MYPAKPGLTIGFHGCDLSLRDRLVTGKTVLQPSNNSYDWLGPGIYFWENNQLRALNYARELQLRKGHKAIIKTPSVIGAVIDMGHCLDLLDACYIEKVQESYELLLSSCNMLNIPIPVNRNVGHSTDLPLRDLDCAVIQSLHFNRDVEKLRPFDSVRGVFVEGKPLYPGSGYHEKDHIQICIRNPNCIKGYFIPRIENNEWLIP